MKHLIVFILFFSFYIAEGQKVDYTLYKDDKCSFLYPTVWMYEKFDKVFGAIYEINITEPKTDSLDKFPEKIVFFKSKLNENEKIEDKINRLVEAHKKKHNNCEVKVKKINANKYQFETAYISNKYSKQVIGKAVVYSHNGIAYVMGFTYELDKEKEYKPIMKKVFKSFKIK